jgi:RND superfamily putative drug exporter
MPEALIERLLQRRWWVLSACAVASLVLGLAGRGLFARLGYAVFRDPAAESTRASALARAHLGDGDPDIVALYRLPAGNAIADITDARVEGPLARVLDRVARDPQVSRVVSVATVGDPRFVSRDHRSTFAVISLRGDARDKLRALDRLQPLLDLPSPIGRPLVGGLVPSGAALTRLAERSLARGEAIALPIVGLLLVAVFGSVVAALLPLAIGGLSIVLALGVLALLSRVIAIDAFAVNVVTILGLGVAIDYALFLVSRYREELARARGDRRRALVRAVATAGRVVLFSGLTVAASLAGLLVFRQPFLRSIAVGGVAVTLLAATLALAVLPAVVSLLGRNLERGRLRRAVDGDARRWRALARGVVRRPAVVCIAVTASLIALALPFRRLQPSRADARSLPKSEEPRAVNDLMRRDFPLATLTPISIVVTMDGDVLDDERAAELFDYTERLRRVPGVARVESLFSFAGVRDRDAASALAEAAARRRGAPGPGGKQPGLESIVHDRHALVRVVSPAAPESPEAQAQLRALRRVPPPPRSERLFYGQAATLSDFAGSLEARAPWMLICVVIAMAIVLFIAFRSVVLPIKAMLMTALSLTASFGAIVFIFQDGRLSRLLAYEPLGTIDASLPVVMFAVVFGLSMDYEVLIIGRIRELYQQTQSNQQAIIEGLTQTGRLVTRAALLMVVVFSAFAAAPLLFVKALGLGMALAVTLDATVVRMLLVPSTMTLLGRLNWWVPRRLRLRFQPMPPH